MTEDVAIRAGLLLAATRTRVVVDAHVALLARSIGAIVLTSDASDIRRLDPSVAIVEV